MKKILLFAVALMTSAAMMAQGYTHSIGGTVGSLYGVSYKGFIFGHENLALIADLGFGLTVSPITETARSGGESYTSRQKNGNTSFWTFEANPNVVYQAEISNGFSWFVGGGVSLGMTKPFAGKDNGISYTYVGAPLMGKFGVNAIGGAEYKFANVPLAISLDFRPGYGLGFKKEKDYDFDDDFGGDWGWGAPARVAAGYDMPEPKSKVVTTSFFDWKLVASVRYCF